MRRNWMIAATGLFVATVVPLSFAGDPVNADDVISKHVAALGGKEHLAARKSQRSGGVIKLGGMEVAFTQEIRRPDCVRVETQTPGGAMIQIARGREGWMLMGPAEPMELPPEQVQLILEVADLDGPFVDYASKGHRVSLVGKEDVDKRAAWKLELHRKGANADDVEYSWFDGETWLLVRSSGRRTTTSGLVEFDSRFSDYREIGGIKIAHRSEFTMSGMKTELLNERVELNVSLADERFARPLQAASPPPAAVTSAPAIRPIVDEPAARARYEQMVASLRAAKSVYIECAHRWSGGMANAHCSYKLWLKKPNYFRMESIGMDGRAAGTLVGDGDTLWIFWPNGRPFLSGEDSQKYEQTRLNSYYSKSAPLARHSIGHEAAILGAGMIMTIIDPSTFHGYTDSLQPTISGYSSLGEKSVDGELCDGIEVRFMDGQRTWELWLSRRDHLPRTLKEVVRVQMDIVKEETWSKVVVDQPMNDDRFKWTPPDGWKLWVMPDAESQLLPASTVAPDFEATLLDGAKKKLSDYRGRIVMLVFWRVGCPPCREEILHLQKFHERFAGRGLVVLGFNSADKHDIAEDLMKKNGLTFPTVVDTSAAAMTCAMTTYHAMAVPTTYLIDREGSIIAAWVGNDPDRATAELKKVGFE